MKVLYVVHASSIEEYSGTPLIAHQYAEEGWELFSIQYRPWGYCNMITFSKNQSQ